VSDPYGICDRLTITAYRSACSDHGSEVVRGIYGDFGVSVINTKKKPHTITIKGCDVWLCFTVGQTVDRGESS